MALGKLIGSAICVALTEVELKETLESLVHVIFQNCLIDISKVTLIYPRADRL